MSQNNKRKPGSNRNQKKSKIEFRRDKDGNLYAVRDGKTISRITSIGD